MWVSETEVSRESWGWSKLVAIEEGMGSRAKVSKDVNSEGENGCACVEDCRDVLGVDNVFGAGSVELASDGLKMDLGDVCFWGGRSVFNVIIIKFKGHRRYSDVNA